MSHSSRFWGIVVVLAFAASACVSDNSAQPGVRAITTDLQYKELQKKNAAPPNTVPAAVQPGLSQPTIPPFGDIGPVPPTALTCATPAPTTQAQEDVTNTVTKGPPKAGTFLWKVEGSEKLPDRDLRLQLPRFTKRQVTNTTGSGNTFKFQTLEKQLSATGGGSTVRSYFDVTSQTATDNNVRPGAGGVSSGRTSTAGVRLVQLDVTRPNGTTRFVPSSPVRYLVTPVLIGPEQFWEDHVVDTLGSGAQSLDHRAYVKGRKTIETCGERIRGWHVVADQSYTASGNRVTRHYEYAVATQMGGIIVFEHVESPCTRSGNTCQEGKPVLEFDASYGREVTD